MVKIFSKLIWAIWYHRFDNPFTNFAGKNCTNGAENVLIYLLKINIMSLCMLIQHHFQKIVCVNSILTCPSPCFSSPSPFLLSYPLFLSSCHAFCPLSSVLFAFLLPFHVTTMFLSSTLPYDPLTCSSGRCCALNIEDEHGNAPNLVPAAGGGAFNAVGHVMYCTFQ